MARKYSNESSDDDDDVRNKRENRRLSGKKESRSNNHHDHGSESDSSDSDRANKTKQYDRWDGHRSDDKHRERASERDGKDRDIRRQNELGDKKGFSRSYDNEEDQVERERGQRGRGRTHRHGDEHRKHDSEENVKVKESNRISEDDDERVKRVRHEREKIYRHEKGHRRQNTEDGYRNRDRYPRRQSEDDESGEEWRKSERRRDRRHDDKRDRHRSEDDNSFKYQRNKEVSERHGDGKSLREKSEGNGRMVEPLKTQGSNLNADAPNLGKSGGIYIPPFKLAQMMKEVQDKSSIEYQRLTWDALRKSINGLVNKVNATNIKNIIPELFSENMIRGRGLFCRSCMKSQMASPGFTDVFAALVSVVNTKFPEVGELLLRRIVLQLKRAYKRNDKVHLFSFFVIIFCL